VRRAILLALVPALALAACGPSSEPGVDIGAGDLVDARDTVPADPGPADEGPGEGTRDLASDSAADPGADLAAADPGTKDPGPPPPVNTLPRFAALAPLSVDMGRTTQVDLRGALSDDEDPVAALVLSWSTPHVALADPGDHVLWVVGPVDWFGVEPVEITVTDTGGLSARATLTVTVNQVTVVVPPPPDECGKVTFRYAAGAGAHAVLLSGTFNGWATAVPAADALADGDGDGVWTVDKVLAPGVYQYKFIVDGTWTADPDNPNQTPDGFGHSNSVLKVAPCAS
jgi:hypothetical protein